MKIIDVFNESSRTISHPYIIAEIGVNHEGNVDLAKKLIDEAAEGGAHAVKFQSYQAETLASRHSPAYWNLSKEPTKSQFELFKKYDKFWKKEFESLKTYCDAIGIEFLSTPFDIESADFLNDLMPVFKISSSDITNKPFIEYICKFNKPIILSTGASYLYEIEEAVSWIKDYGNKLALLHCVLNYPTPEKNANLGMIKGLKEKFPTIPIGYSDHTEPLGMKSLEVAVLLGAEIIEKHFTHNKQLPGNDHYHAMDKEDLKKFTATLNRIFTLVGQCAVTSLEDEEPARLNARRSLVAQCLIPQGKKIEPPDLTWKRPAHGVSPKFIEEVVGKTALRDIEEDEIIQWHYFS
ncbi:MAG: N-acetylneuraminate synthase family protein [Gammaproteobacteria bacterium]|nr:N-acetylneuraminate synthase family protein [Gammaproteobacteria bacterium]